MLKGFLDNSNLREKKISLDLDLTVSHTLGHSLKWFMTITMIYSKINNWKELLMIL